MVGPGSPHQLVGPGSPHQLVGPDSPQQLVRPDSPHQLVRPDSPQQLVGPDPPHQLVGPDSPHQLVSCHDVKILTRSPLCENVTTVAPAAVSRSGHRRPSNAVAPKHTRKSPRWAPQDLSAFRTESIQETPAVHQLAGLGEVILKVNLSR